MKTKSLLFVNGRFGFVIFNLLLLLILMFSSRCLAQTNLPPLNPPPLSISSPTNGATFYTPTNIQLVATVGYSDIPFQTNAGNYIVEFFAGTNDLGEGVLKISSGFSGLYFLTWTNPLPGDYALVAIAVDNAGGIVASEPVDITVLQSLSLPPVSITSPKEGTIFYAPTNIQIDASVFSPPATNVEFFAGTNDLGRGIFQPTLPLYGQAFSLTWTNVPTGNYTLTAVATDNDGSSSTSAPVAISVIQPLPPTNLFSVVRIISPANDATFRAPINLPLFAFFTYPDALGEYGAVEFYDGTNFLGSGQPVSTPTPLPPTHGLVPVPPTGLSTNIYSLVWSNAPVGDHVLTAQAVVGNLLNAVVLRIVSAPVNITILPPLPPPANRPAVVSIVATDPVAVEGTNYWVWPGETNSPPTWTAWPAAISFTNWGPKTATFTVRRSGDINTNLTVTYAVSGTASNGVDYIALPDFIDIPAGDNAALITIVPINTSLTEVAKTVVLTLTPSTNSPPDYTLGFPRRAAALIVDSNRPRPVTGVLSEGYFHLNANGPDGAWFYIEYSTNLISWTPVCTNQVVNGSIDFVDPNAQDHPSRFYRAVAQADSP